MNPVKRELDCYPSDPWYARLFLRVANREGIMTAVVVAGLILGGVIWYQTAAAQNKATTAIADSVVQIRDAVTGGEENAKFMRQFTMEAKLQREHQTERIAAVEQEMRQLRLIVADLVEALKSKNSPAVPPGTGG